MQCECYYGKAVGMKKMIEPFVYNFQDLMITHLVMKHNNFYMKRLM